jgi:hypothetical protein
MWQRPGRWLGKTPHHLENLDALLDVFPDAKILHTHRDPVRVVASFASMIAHGRAIFSDRADAREVGAQIAEKAVRAVTRRKCATRRATRILNVAYADARRSFKRSGASTISWGDVSRRRPALHATLVARAPGQGGVHRLTEDFGLDATGRPTLSLIAAASA